ncbi:MAG: AAA family ATPase [Treponema sp.]|nr:AAA family ATPase [Treponema sp.]
MISNLKGIKIQGRKFSANPEDFCFWNTDKIRLSLVYGKNGSGKSTISDAFTLLKNNENDDFCCISEITFDNHSLSEDDKKSIHVFNEKFIDSNIKIKEDGIDSIVMFGKQVDIDNQISETEKRLNSKKTEIENQNNIVTNFLDVSNANSPIYFLNQCISELKRDNGWAGKERVIKSARVNSPVTQTTVANIISQYKTEKELEVLIQDYTEKKKLFDSVTSNSTEIDQEVTLFNFGKIDSKAKALLTKKIEQSELTEREKRIFSFIENNGQDLLTKAKTYFSIEDSDFCPYCYQTIDEEYKSNLMEEFKKVLNKEVEDYQKELETLKIKNLSFDISPYEQIERSVTQTVQLELDKINKIIQTYNKLIDNRINNVYQDFSEEDYNIFIEDSIQPLNEALKKLEEKRKQFNDLVKNKNNLKNELLTLNSQIANKQILEKYLKYEEQLKKQETENTKLSTLENEKSEIEKELSSLNEQKKSIKIAQEHINYLLQYVFFSKDKLTIESHDGIYQIKSSGLSVKPNQISCGERNIMALCYYFTELFSGKDEAAIYSDTNLLIIDDPVSSFDKENRVGVLSLLKYELQHFVSGNPETKVLIMTHDLMAFYDIEKIAQELNSHNECTYNFIELAQTGLKDFSFKKSNEYSKLLKTIYNFAVSPSDNMEIESYIGNIIRRVVEAYSTFIYKVGIDAISFDEEILSEIENTKQQEYFSNLMYRILLNGESHSEERVRSLEDFCNGISIDEKNRIAKDILCFLYLLNPVHISKHLQGIVNAEDKIKEWCATLPS